MAIRKKRTYKKPVILPSEKPAPVARREVLRLPPPYPRPVTVPLDILIDYMKFHKIKPIAYKGGYNILYVEKKEKNNADK